METIALSSGRDVKQLIYFVNDYQYNGHGEVSGGR
jgi:hypothetical protein